MGETEWRELLEVLAPVTESYLRRALREMQTPVEQPFAGIRQKSFEELEQSLLAMERVYAAALEAGDRQRARYCRNVVIQAKDHAKLAARGAKTSAEVAAQKLQMAEWMLVWLENPGVFPVWVRLRKAQIEKQATEAR